MIVLDTNVLSELMRAGGSSAILDWVARFPSRTLFTTVISQAEILSGVAIMPAGRKRFGLEAAAHRMLDGDFAGRILAFDVRAAPHYGEIMASRRRSGRTTAPLDMMIAAIARVHDAAVTTRNTSHFEDCGVELHNPWG